MPLAVRFRKGLYRLVDLDTNGIAQGANGKPIDQGGGASEAAKKKLEKQAQAVNISQQEKLQKMVEARRVLAARLGAQTRYRNSKKRKR